MSASEDDSSQGHDRLIARAVDVCSADERISAVFVGGSVARGEADRFSDLDLCIVARDAEFEDVLTDRKEIASRLGTPLFLEDWGAEDPELFVILASGADLEIIFVREGRLHEIQVGPIRPILDRRGVLDDLDVPMRTPGRDDLVGELRHTLAWFWHDVSHFVTAAGRRQVWWAAGQVEALRGYCVNLVRIEQGVREENEPYWKIDAEISTGSLEPMRSTYVPPELDAMIRSAADLLTFFGMHGRAAAEAYGLEYPVELERLMRDQLDGLSATRNA